MIKLFEMFAGYGGASFGLKKAGIPFECVGYSEIDKAAIQCYSQNHKGKNYGDCSKIDPKELNDFDLLTGGFPCQDVSVAGNRDLSKGRTNLYLEILRIAEYKKPKYILLENVKGLLSVEVNERKLVHKIVADLQKIGYGVVWKVLNSKDYGIPQSRERIWFVCKLGGWDFMEFMFPNKEELKIFLKDILEEEVVQKDNYVCMIQRPHGANKGGERAKDGVCPSITSGASWEHNNHVACYDNYNKKWKENGEIGTIGRHCGSSTNSGSYSILKDMRIRKLTPKECFRLMGFLDDEINLEGISNSQCYKLAGNGWDINLVSKIFKKMFK